VGIEYAPKRPGEQQESYVDVGKAARVLGWRPLVSLEDGLARSYAAFAAQHHARRRPTRSP
jgi:UDP-glucose 4-epimerase